MNVFEAYEKVAEKMPTVEIKKPETDEIFKVDETVEEVQNVEQVAHESNKLNEKDYDEIAKRIAEIMATKKEGE